MQELAQSGALPIAEHTAELLQQLGLVARVLGVGALEAFVEGRQRGAPSAQRIALARGEVGDPNDRAADRVMPALQPIDDGDLLGKVRPHEGKERFFLVGEVSEELVAQDLEASDEPGRERLSTMGSALRFNNLKIAASEQAPRVCQGALGVCGIMGFKNDTPFSVGRHLRDTMSACLMVANERIHQTNASLLLIAKEV